MRKPPLKERSGENMYICRSRNGNPISRMTMKTVIAFIPNVLTLCNLLSGCAAVSALFLRADFQAAFWLVIAAAVFDFFDGFAARMLHVSSPIGKELDSLADMVSFGVVPATVVFMLSMAAGEAGYGVSWLAYGGFLIAAFSALRLAKFNIDERQTEEFRGLPTPACALFFVSLPMLFVQGNGAEGGWASMPSEGWSLLAHPAVLLPLTAVFSALLVCDMPMFSLKFKTFGWEKNKLRYVFLFLSVIFIVWLGLAAPVMIILAYIVISTGRAVICRKCVKG